MKKYAIAAIVALSAMSVASAYAGADRTLFGGGGEVAGKSGKGNTGGKGASGNHSGEGSKSSSKSGK